MSAYDELAGMVTFRPLTEKFPPSNYVPNRFDSTWSSTVKLLAAEIAHMEPRETILEVDLPPSAIRRDGLPRADARAVSDAIILTMIGCAKARTEKMRKGDALIRKYGGLSAALKATHPDVGGRAEDFILVNEARKQPEIRFRCNTFSPWTDNVRAIALGMEALRKVDRYGITEADQQYAGFALLTA